MNEIRVPRNIEEGHYMVDLVTGVWTKLDGISVDDVPDVSIVDECPECDEAGETIKNLREALSTEREAAKQNRDELSAMIDTYQETHRKLIKSQGRVRGLVGERDAARQERDVAVAQVNALRDQDGQWETAARASQREVDELTERLAEALKDDELVLVNKVVTHESYMVDNGMGLRAVAPLPKRVTEETWTRRGVL